MKLTIPAAVILAGLPLMAGTLTSEERNFLLTQLEKSSHTVQGALEGVSVSQWKFKPAPDRWSIAECAEHIATADTAMFMFGTSQLLKMSPPADAVRRRDNSVLAATTDRTTKVKTAEFLEPKGKYADKTAVLDAFLKTRALISEYVKSTQEDLRVHGFQGPAGYVDGYQFLLALSAHGERHAAQIAEVKADARYPKK
jgi:hypothetical protein